MRPGQVHACHRDHHRQAGDQHRPPRGRRRSRQRRLLAAPRFALLALAAQVEHRVVDADRQADQQDHLVDRAVDRRDVAGRRRPGRSSRARPSARAESERWPRPARRTRSSRITSVIGSEVTNALLKSLLIESSTCLLMLASPTCSTVKSGLAACAAAVAFERRADPVRGLVLVAGDLEAQQGRMPVSGDLSGVARLVGALECLGVGNRSEAALDVADDGSEGRVARGGAVALDEHLLDLMLREGVVDRARGAPGLADPALSGGLGLRPDRAADRERDEHERQPAPDRLLAMLSAPAPGAGG